MKNGCYITDKGVKYEVCNNQIMVEHENGYYGCLYGKSSMSIFKDNKEVLHTGFRNINTPDELYEILSEMPSFTEKLANIDFDDEEEDDIWTIKWGIVEKGVGNKNMKRKKDRKPKIVIKTRAGGYTKIYANGKWQKGVYNIDFHADCTPLRYPYIKISCEFDKHKTDKNGSVIYDEVKKDFAKEHIVARI